MFVHISELVSKRMVVPLGLVVALLIVTPRATADRTKRAVGPLPLGIVQVPSGDEVAERLTASPGPHPALSLNGRFGQFVLTSASTGAASFAGATLNGATAVAFEGVRFSDTVNVTRSKNIRFTRCIFEAGIIIREGSENITIESSSLVGGMNGINIYAPAPKDPVRRVTIRDNNISGQANDNIQVGGAEDVLIEGNEIHDPIDNANHNDGIQAMRSQRLQIRNNRFWGQDEAILLKPEAVLGSDSRVETTTIANNLLVRSRGAGIILMGARTVSLVGNTIFDNHFQDVIVHRGSEDVDIHQNVLVRLDVVAGVKQPREGRNCVQRGGSGMGVISSPPDFLDRVHYAQRLSSPCLGLGYVG